MITKQHVLTIIFVLFVGAMITTATTTSLPMAFSEIPSIHNQLQDKIPINELICGNAEHVLVMRDNGEPACVSEKTVKRISWEPIERPIIISHPRNPTGDWCGTESFCSDDDSESKHVIVAESLAINDKQTLHKLENKNILTTNSQIKKQLNSDVYPNEIIVELFIDATFSGKIIQGLILLPYSSSLPSTEEEDYYYNVVDSQGNFFLGTN